MFSNHPLFSCKLIRKRRIIGYQSKCCVKNKENNDNNQTNIWMYFPSPTTSSRVCHKFMFKFFLLQAWLQSKHKEPSLASRRREDRWIHSFPKCISTKRKVGVRVKRLHFKTFRKNENYIVSNVVQQGWRYSSGGNKRST